MIDNEEYDIFVSYDMLASDYAKIVYDALTRRGYKVFIAHLEEVHMDGNFRDVIDKAIKNCKVFILILNYDTLKRSEVKREVLIASKNGKLSNANNFWIFHENSPDIPRGSNEFTNETGIQLEVLNQNDFSIPSELGTKTLRKCDERRNSQIPDFSTIFPIKEDLAEENFIKNFAIQYKNQGYKADFQSNTWKNFYVDLVLRKDNEMILCEFKKFARQVNPNTFRQLLTYKSEIENIEPETRVKLWLIVHDSFDLKQRSEAKDYGIELFDENNLVKGDLSVSTDRLVYPLHSIVHLRIKPELKIKNSPIIIRVFDSNQVQIFEDKIPLQMDKTFQEYDIPMKENFWNIGQEYYVKVKHGFSDATDSFTIQERGSIIQLDQKVYTWTDQVVITIISPDSDKDNQKVETIGNKHDSRITIKTSKGMLRNYSLQETGKSTGIFQGLIKLTGFKNDFVSYDHLPNFGTTSGSGPVDGLLSCSNSDVLEIIFENGNNTVIGKALIRWNIGEIQWIKPNFSINEQAVVRVIDPDMNLDPYFIDEFFVRVWSDSDTEGINLKVKETNGSSGIFHGKIQLTNSKSDENSLCVSNGDTITAEYVDKTLPDPYQIGNNLKIFSTAMIGENLPPLKRIKLKNPRILDENGHLLTSVSKGQKIQITCDLTNMTNYDQTFAYLVSIKDSDNISIGPSWITGTILKGQSFTSSLSWIPECSGKYFATIFIWKSVDEPESLSHPITIEIPVL